MPNANKWLNCAQCNFFPLSPFCPQFPVLNTLYLSYMLSSLSLLQGLCRTALITIGHRIKTQNFNQNSQQKRMFSQFVLSYMHILNSLSSLFNSPGHWYFFFNTTLSCFRFHGVPRFQVGLVGRVISVNLELVQYEHGHQFWRLLFQIGLTTTKSSKSILFLELFFFIQPHQRPKGNSVGCQLHIDHVLLFHLNFLIYFKCIMEFVF